MTETSSPTSLPLWPDWQTQVETIRREWNQAAQRWEARALSCELRTRSPQRLDSGREPIEDSPLFGGPRQAALFG